MSGVRIAVDADGAPSFMPWGEGKEMLVDGVSFAYASNTYRGPGTGTIRGAGLMFESAMADDRLYQMVLAEEDVRKLIGELTRILRQQDEWDRRGGAA
jgi:hypothetical protein